MSSRTSAEAVPEQGLQLERALLQVSVAARSSVLHRLLCRGRQRAPTLECPRTIQHPEAENVGRSTQTRLRASSVSPPTQLRVLVPNI